MANAKRTAATPAPETAAAAQAVSDQATISSASPFSSKAKRI